MHRFNSSSSIARFRLTALVLCAKCVLVPVTAFLLVYSLGMNDHFLIKLSLLLIGACLGLQLFQVILAARTYCPLCRTPVLGRRNCVRHRKSRGLFGSHRLRVAVALLCTNSFRCPYCHEPSVLEVRKRGSEYANPRS